MARFEFKIPAVIGRVLCWLGEHDFQVLDVSFGFNPGQTIEKVVCRRCGLKVTRQA